jgi:4-amino-4-deoxy-L-arabinose transferase-like glycosyltransferase
MAAKKTRQNPSRLDPSKKKSPAERSPRALLQISFNRRAFILVLAMGVIVRVIVFLYMGYFNNDNHLEVIKYVADNWLPARADQFNQAYHPPLYYFLAAPLLHLGNLPAVHALSLILSIATLVLIAILLCQTPWVTDKFRHWCLALAALQPQFIMHGLFISNDALAIFLGVLIFFQCRCLQQKPSRFNACLLGTWLGLGLLTKATFLAFVGPLILFIWMVRRQHRLPRRWLLSELSLFLLFASVLGCYKYAENFFLFGNPVVSNLDLWAWARSQQPTWIGPQSLFDFNLSKLVRNPIISISSAHSYPLMLYGSFWYPLIPESTFHGNLIAPINRLGSLIYIVALCPTLLTGVGAVQMAMAAARFGSEATPIPSADNGDRAVYEGSLLLTLVLNLVLILIVGWRSDVWSVFQGRLLFPSYFVFLLAFNRGMEWAQSSRPMMIATRSLMISLLVLFLTYFVAEIWLAGAYPSNPLRTNHMPYTIDMNAR